MPRDVAFVTWNDHGFWQVDLYPAASEWTPEDWNSCPEPDAFFTMARGQSCEDAADKAYKKWPDAEVRIDCIDEGAADVYAGDPF